MTKHDIEEELSASQRFFAQFNITKSCRRKIAKHAYYKQSHPGKWRRDPWSREDIDRILSRDMPDKLLAKEIGRSITAIQTRRALCKKAIRDGASPYGEPA